MNFSKLFLGLLFVASPLFASSNDSLPQHDIFNPNSTALITLPINNQVQAEIFNPNTTALIALPNTLPNNNQAQAQNQQFVSYYTQIDENGEIVINRGLFHVYALFPQNNYVSAYDSTDAEDND